MKLPFFIVLVVLTFSSCNSEDNKSKPTDIATSIEQTTTPASDGPEAATTTSTAQFSVDGKQLDLGAAVLVQNDRSGLKPGLGKLAVLTASGGPNREALTLNFLLDTKTGEYPVVGTGFQRGPSDNGEVYGGLMGGTPELTKYKVKITECKDLGSNGSGGHRWSISGTFEDIVIEAMPLMLMDPARKHPGSVTIKSGKFSNLTFDDNWDDIMKKAVDQNR